MIEWYQAQDARRRARQVVAAWPGGGTRDPELGSQGLGLAARYQPLLARRWVAGLFRTERRPGPYLMVRADGHVGRLADPPLRIAFGFYREPSAALVGVHVVADGCPGLAEASPTGLPVFEQLYGLEDGDTVARLRDTFAHHALHLCFAEASPTMAMEVVDDQGRVVQLSPPACRFDRILPMPLELRRALTRQLTELAAYHQRTPRDTGRALRERAFDFPAREHPVLPRGIAPAQTPPPAPARRWWHVWRPVTPR